MTVSPASPIIVEATIDAHVTVVSWKPPRDKWHEGLVSGAANAPSNDNDGRPAARLLESANWPEAEGRVAIARHGKPNEALAHRHRS